MLCTINGVSPERTSRHIFTAKSRQVDCSFNLSTDFAYATLTRLFFKLNQSGTEFHELVQSFALAFPLLLTLHALEEELDAGLPSHQLTRLTTINL